MPYIVRASCDAPQAQVAVCFGGAGDERGIGSLWSLQLVTEEIMGAQRSCAWTQDAWGY